MKIIHVVSNYYPAHGGPQYTMKHLSEKMALNYDDEITVLTSNSLYGPEMPIFSEITPSAETINGVLVRRFPFARWHYQILNFANKVSGKLRRKALPYSIMKKKWGFHCKAIDKAMEKTSADVIMATTAHYNFCDYPFWRSTKSNPKPFILYGAIHFHINWAKESPFIQRALACDCYIANTEYERQKLLSYGMSPHKIVTIGTGIDVSDMHCHIEKVKAFKEKYSINNNDLLIGHVGRLSEGKGVGILIEAFAELYKIHKNIKLVLAGSKTAYSIKLIDSLHEKKLPIIFLENFTDSEKAVIMNALDIFVLGSTGESFGVVFLEAWACKKPVIGANIGAIASLLDANEDSLLFQPNDYKSMASQIKILIQDPVKRKSLGEAGYNKVIEKYNWNSIVEKYRNAYMLGIKNFEKKDVQ